MSETWNLTQAWAWIRWRDATKVAAYASETHMGIAEEIVFPDGAAVIEEDHRAALLAALQDGRLVTRGLPAGDAPATVIAVPAADWPALVPVAPSEARYARGRKVAWRALSFPAAELQRLWPAPDGGRTAISVSA